MKPEWRYAKQFAIHERTAGVVRLAIKATHLQLANERKKLKKLTYGS